MRPHIAIRRAGPREHPRIESFYRAYGYRARVTHAAVVFLAESNGDLVGLLRLEPEYGNTVLRGMHVTPIHQRRGVGTALLRVVEEHLATIPCYCVPYAHLEAFYGQVGFVKVAPEGAPAFLAVRLAEYQTRGLDVILMRRPERG